jgi:Fungal specific transcription factor domain
LTSSPIQGSNTLLDNTFRAVSLARLSLLYRNPNLMHESRKLYGRSLVLLNKALSDQRQGRSSETLSATILFSFYEMFSSSHETSAGYDSWVKHAGGAGALMRLRGPNATGIDWTDLCSWPIAMLWSLRLLNLANRVF